MGRTGFGLGSLTLGWYGIGGLIGLLAGPVAYVVMKRALGGRGGPRDGSATVEG